jgi:hypothetical protein
MQLAMQCSRAAPTQCAGFRGDDGEAYEAGAACVVWLDAAAGCGCSANNAGQQQQQEQQQRQRPRRVLQCTWHLS